jgi:hypothetical protein
VVSFPGAGNEQIQNRISGPGLAQGSPHANYSRAVDTMPFRRHASLAHLPLRTAGREIVPRSRSLYVLSKMHEFGISIPTEKPKG